MEWFYLEYRLLGIGWGKCLEIIIIVVSIEDVRVYGLKDEDLKEEVVWVVIWEEVCWVSKDDGDCWSKLKYCVDYGYWFCRR